MILPLTFLGGVFYSVDRLPAPWHEISHANPIFYLVNAVRYGFLGTSDVSFVLVAGGDGRARGGHGGVELMAVSDRAPAQALKTRAGYRSSSVAITSLQFGAAIAGTIFDEIGAGGDVAAALGLRRGDPAGDLAPVAARATRRATCGSSRSSGSCWAR